MRSSIYFGIGFLLWLSLMGCGRDSRPGCRGNFSIRPEQKVGERAPDFTLHLLEDREQKITLSEVTKDHPVLLVFWATWCPSCLGEIPTLNEWYDKYTREELEILAINVAEPPGQILEFVKKTPLRFPSLLDEDGRVALRYGLVALPSAVFLAKGGEIIYYGFGLPTDMDQLLAQT